MILFFVLLLGFIFVGIGHSLVQRKKQNEPPSKEKIRIGGALSFFGGWMIGVSTRGYVQKEKVTSNLVKSVSFFATISVWALLSELYYVNMVTNSYKTPLGILYRDVYMTVPGFVVGLLSESYFKPSKK